MQNRNVWGSISVALIAIIATLAHLVEIWERRAEERPLGRLSQQDIRSRMRLLSRISLLPEAAEMSINPQGSISRDGHNKRYWFVDYNDRAGEFTGHVQWDADTGELIILSRKTTVSLVSVPDLTRREAIAHALRLLKQTGIGIQNERWLLRDSPILYGRIWLINATSSERLALIKIDKHLDQVIYMHIAPRLTFSRRRIL